MFPVCPFLLLRKQGVVTVSQPIRSLLSFHCFVCQNTFMSPTMRHYNIKKQYVN